MHIFVDKNNENYYRLSMSCVKQAGVTKPSIAPRRIPSEELLERAGEAAILHDGREYWLRQTQNGKLILTA